jgi:hypothetical protein
VTDKRASPLNEVSGCGGIDEVGRVAHQECVSIGALQVALRTLDRAILMRNGGVAGRLYPVGPRRCRARILIDLIDAPLSPRCKTARALR